MQYSASAAALRFEQAADVKIPDDKDLSMCQDILLRLCRCAVSTEMDDITLDQLLTTVETAESLIKQADMIKSLAGKAAECMDRPAAQVRRRFF